MRNTRARSFRFGLAALPGLAVVAAMVAGPAAAAVQSITIFECGRAKTLDKSMFSPGVDVGVAYDIPINCYLIRHDKDLMIWDTGLADSLVEKPEGVVVAGGKLTIFVKKTLASQMKAIGVSPRDVKYMALSHMHPDITGNVGLFTAATWYVQKAEFDAALGKTPKKFRFDPKTYSGLRANKTVMLTGRKDVFGDGSVIIIPAPGHTPGSQVLFVKLPSGPVILAGDLWHFESNRTNNIVPAGNFSIEMTRKSMAKINALAARTGARVWLNHDRDQSASLPHAPRSIR